MAVLVVTGVASIQLLQAEDAVPPKTKNIVDMADSVNNQDFYDTKNPDAVWSSELKMPWAKSSAINAYDDKKQPSEGSASESSGTASAGVAATGAVAGVTVGEVNGKKVDAEQLVNIRVLYTLDAANSKASFSPVTAQTELFRQMSKHCTNGFQKIAEWSEPEGSDYYMYYQFKCMEKR
jgi:hypothetical protein